MRRSPWGGRRPRGMALVSALVLMMGALILGVSVARAAFASMASARLERERLLARAAAEAALHDAQADIAGGVDPSSARAGWFAAGSGGFADGCGHGSQDLGLCLPAASALAPVWQVLDLADTDAPLVPYGRYTGATMATGSGLLPGRLPAYLVERLETGAAGPPGPPAGSTYRITAIGFGTRAATRVVLQALYRVPAPASPPVGPDAPAGGDPAGGDPAGDGTAGGGTGTQEGDGSGPAAAPAPAPAPGTTPVPGTTPAPGAAPRPGTVPAAAPPSGTLSIGRIAWRDIPNWPELHARAIE
jgi:type IV pilus assembly protein PilX